MGDTSVDFFVSYTSADCPWAEWIAWELEDAGFSVIVQAWDMQPGSNFVVEMHHATRAAARTIAVLSPAFLESPYCEAEWAAAFAKDPMGRERTLLPVRVRDCDLDGLLGPIVYVDMVGLSEAASRDRLLSGLKVRARPAGAPAFPAADGVAAGERVRRPAGGGAAIFNVEIRTATFVGREEQLRALSDGLRVRGRGRVAVSAVHGIGGVGKTQLAAYYASTHRDAYDVIWWVRAEQPETMRADLAALAARLGLAEALAADEQVAVDAACDWLARNDRWLVVFDNAPDPDAVRGLLVEGAGGHIVVTSRAHADWRAVGALPLSLDVWERAESLAFLRERTAEPDDVVLGEVAEVLGDLPLALEQAAAYSNRQAIGLEGYLQRLRDRAPKLLSAGGPAGYEHTIATVWQLAFEQAAIDPLAGRLLGVCAHVAADRIPRELLEGVPGEADGVSVEVLDAVDDAIALLLGYALLTVSGEQTFAMHRLVGRLARTNAGASVREGAVVDAIGALQTIFPWAAWEYEQWPACERLLAHALQASTHAERDAVALPQTAALLLRAGVYQRERAQYTSACELVERAVAIYEAQPGRPGAELASALDVLGTILLLLARLSAARDVLQRALAISETVHGTEHREVARTLGNLAIVQQQLGEFEVARVSLQRVLAIFEAVYGPEHPEVARTLTNLGNVQRELGELEAAHVTLQRALTINEAVYGPEHPSVASTLGNLGNVQAQLGEFEAARVTQQRALTIFEAVYGPEHPEVARTLTNLGIVQQQLGELEAARVTLQRVLTIFEAVYGREHPEVAITLTNLGNVQERLGDLEAARSFIGRALGIFERRLGPDHPHTKQARVNLETLSR